MDAIEYVRRQLASSRRILDATLRDTTDDQLNWRPPGAANPIGVTLLHLAAAEDMFVQRTLRGQRTLWSADGWAERVGVPAPPGRDNWQELASARLEIAPLLAYERAVRNATDEYLSTLTDSDLDREQEFFGRSRQVADVLALVVTHAVGHAGEIGALKGAQGVTGLPL